MPGLSTTQQWEYLSVEITNVKDADRDNLFKTYGAQNWELVSVDTKPGLFSSRTIAYFKRPWKFAS